MNRQKTSHGPESSHKKTLLIAVIFCIAFVIIVIVALLIRITILFSQSTFDSRHQFLLFVQKNGNAEIIAFNPDTQSINVLKIFGTDSALEIENATATRYDAQVHDIYDGNSEAITAFLWRLLFELPAFSSQHLNQADVYKLWVFTKKVNPGSITKQEIHFPLTEDLKSQLSSSLLFTDHTLFQEGQTITIVNATEVGGEGNKLAATLTNIGANVIAVNTADAKEKKSHIYYRGTLTYTVKRLHQLLSFPTSVYSQPYSDIMIVIGEDEKRNE